MTIEPPDATPAGLSKLVAVTLRPAARRLWIWPLLAAVLIAAAGWWMRQRIDRAMQGDLALNLQSVLKANAMALRFWFAEQEDDVKALTADGRIQSYITELARLAQTGASPGLLANSEPARVLESELKPLLESQGYVDYVVISPDRRILASPVQALVGSSTPGAYEAFLQPALAGQRAGCAPFPIEAGMRDAAGSLHASRATMFVAAPLVSSNGSIYAVLALRLNPQEDFSENFSIGRIGESGDAYAFSSDGLMLSTGRSNSLFRALGLIPNRDEATPILNLRLLDPGMDLRNRKPAAANHGGFPLTLPVREATTHGTGFDVHGYRDYRGVPVVGAWTWLPEYDMGLVVEMDKDEAFHPLVALDRATLALFGVLVCVGLGILSFTIGVERLRKRVQKSAQVTRQLGQYVLEQEIGSGGYGRVYRARHAMLRRPVAIKLLQPDKSTETHLKRFEREVQATSQLTHPNTVAIYDYGRTPDGVFYCAMEFLTGLSLDNLVEQFGPQPEGRVIHILRQVCGSLVEAHESGLIHRDIKPGNIMLTCRGGIHDVVKVLDFGLVKPLSDTLDHDGAQAETIVGTPRYMSPEAIEKPESANARSDLYSLGAVGYFLLVGQPIVDGATPREIFLKQLHEAPASPARRLGRSVDASLERLILQCLAKDPAQRPLSARVLEEELSRCASAGQWTQAVATEWWRTHHARLELPPAGKVAERTLVILPRA